MATNIEDIKVSGVRHTAQSIRNFTLFKSLNINDLFVLFYDYFELEDKDIPTEDDEDGGYPALAIKTSSTTYKVIFWSKSGNEKVARYINTKELGAQGLLQEHSCSYEIDPEHYVAIMRVQEDDLQEFLLQVIEY